jgi:hypothetical protein
MALLSMQKILNKNTQMRYLLERVNGKASLQGARSLFKGQLLSSICYNTINEQLEFQTKNTPFVLAPKK